jgi:hypothetical protein
MAETIIFHCDMCGQKSDEEPAAWPRRERCRVELVFRGQRFVLPGADPMAAPPPPPPSFDWSAPPPSAFGPSPFPQPMPLPLDPAAQAGPPDEDARVAYTLCDACMRRVGGLFDMRLETLEEYSLRAERAAQDAARAASMAASGGFVPRSIKGEMVTQFPTRQPSEHSGPGPGGLVDQFPTEPPVPPGVKVVPPQGPQGVTMVPPQEKSEGKKAADKPVEPS